MSTSGHPDPIELVENANLLNKRPEMSTSGHSYQNDQMELMKKSLKKRPNYLNTVFFTGLCPEQKGRDARNDARCQAA